MKLTETNMLFIGAGLAALALLYLVKKPGASSDVGVAIGGAVVNVANGAATGVVDGVSQIIGIPTTSEMITDPAEAQAYRDQYGWWQAMGHMSASTYWGTHS